MRGEGMGPNLLRGISQRDLPFSESMRVLVAVELRRMEEITQDPTIYCISGFRV